MHFLYPQQVIQSRIKLFNRKIIVFGLFRIPIFTEKIPIFTEM